MTVATELTIRVSVPDVWDTVLLRVAPHWTIARVKREALDVAMGRHVEADAPRACRCDSLMSGSPSRYGALARALLTPAAHA